LNGAGFAFRGDHWIASVSMQANTNYSMDFFPPDIAIFESGVFPKCKQPLSLDWTGTHP
jgi:hypothetical protein